MHAKNIFVMYYYRLLLGLERGLSGAVEIGGETVETVSDFILRGSKIIADGDCT